MTQRPDYQRGDVRLFLGDCLDVLAGLEAGQSIPGLHYAVVDNQPTPDELVARVAEAKAAQLRAKLEGDGGQHEYEPKLQEVIVGMSGKRRR